MCVASFHTWAYFLPFSSEYPLMQAEKIYIFDTNREILWVTALQHKLLILLDLLKVLVSKCRCDFCFEIENWKWNLSFGVSTSLPLPSSLLSKLPLSLANLLYLHWLLIHWLLCFVPFSNAFISSPHTASHTAVSVAHQMAVPLARLLPYVSIIGICWMNGLYVPRGISNNFFPGSRASTLCFRCFLPYFWICLLVDCNSPFRFRSAFLLLFAHLFHAHTRPTPYAPPPPLFAVEI